MEFALAMYSNNNNLFKNMKKHILQLSIVAFSISLMIVILFTFNSCEEKEKHPKVETKMITAISSSSFKVSAKVLESGEYKILDYGFIYYIGSEPSNTYYSTNNKISVGKAIVTDTFETIFDIGNVYFTPNQKCFVKAYITNEKGTIYGNAISKEILKLQATGIVPNVAKVGDTITVNGASFSLVPSNNTVSFNNTNAKVVSSTSGSLRVIVPSGISTYYYDSYIDIKVSSGSQYYELSNVFQLASSPTSFSPKTGNWTTAINVYGSALENSTLYFDDIQISTSSRSSNYITAYLPSTFVKKQFKIYVYSGGVKTEVPGGYFIIDNLVVNKPASLKYLPGTTISFSGNTFNSTQSFNKLYLGTTSISSRGYSNLEFLVPSSMSAGEYPAIITNGVDSVNLPYNIAIIRPVITEISPISGYPGSNIILKGENLIIGNVQYSNVYFDSKSVYTNSGDSTSINVKVPWMSPGNYSVIAELGGLRVNSPVKFTVIEPKINSLTPATGPAGNSIVINGEGFGTNNSISVYFGNYSASIMSSTNTQINVKAPSGISSGAWMVKVYINSYELSTTGTYTVP